MKLAGAIVTLDDAMGTSQFSTLSQAQQTDFTQQARGIADSYQQQMDALQNLHNTRVTTLKEEISAARQLREVVKSLNLSELSPLTADQRVSFARATFADLQLKAENGDMASAGQLGDAARSYLTELSAQRGADPLYVNEFNEVTGYLDALGLQLGAELDPLGAIENLNRQLKAEQSKLVANSQRELQLLADQYGELTGIESGVEAQKELIDALPQELATALGGLVSATVSPPSTTTAPSTDPTTETPAADPIRDLYTIGLGREPDEDGYRYWRQIYDDGTTLAELKKQFLTAATHNNESINQAYFATGGVVTRPQRFLFEREISGQMGMRGEAGAEAIIPVGSGYIPAKFDSSLVNELRALRKQNADQGQQIVQLMPLIQVRNTMCQQTRHTHVTS